MMPEPTPVAGPKRPNPTSVCVVIVTTLGIAFATTVATDDVGGVPTGDVEEEAVEGDGAIDAALGDDVPGEAAGLWAGLAAELAAGLGEGVGVAAPEVSWSTASTRPAVSSELRSAAAKATRKVYDGSLRGEGGGGGGVAIGSVGAEAGAHGSEVHGSDPQEAMGGVSAGAGGQSDGAGLGA